VEQRQLVNAKLDPTNSVPLGPLGSALPSVKVSDCAPDRISPASSPVVEKCSGKLTRQSNHPGVLATAHRPGRLRKAVGHGWTKKGVSLQSLSRASRCSGPATSARLRLTRARAVARTLGKPGLEGFLVLEPPSSKVRNQAWQLCKEGPRIS